MYRRPLALIAFLGLILSTLSAHAEDSPLPTDGIEEPLTGPLDLPDAIRGPGGAELVRSVGLGHAGLMNFPRTVRIHYSYGIKEPAVGAPIGWDAKVYCFDRKGAAHAHLHRDLRPPGNNGPPSRDRFERVSAPPGLFFLRRHDAGCDYYGVLRQCYVVVSGVRRRVEGAVLSAERTLDQIEREGLDLLITIAQLVREAPSAVRPVPRPSMRRVVVEPVAHGSVPEGARDVAALFVRIQVEPDVSVSDEQSVRLWVLSGSEVKNVLTSGQSLRQGPVLSFPLGSAGEAAAGDVRIWRVWEGPQLAIEEVLVRLTDGRGEWRAP